MKHAYTIFLIFLCSIFNNNHAMEKENIKIAQQLPVPNEILCYIIQLAYPGTDFYHCDRQNTDSMKEQQIKKDFAIFATGIIELRYICKQFNHIITTQITDSLQLNKNMLDMLLARYTQANIPCFIKGAKVLDMLLIRSTQANIPYFIKVAVEHGADTNFACPIDGFTPLLNATSANCYLACKFLLEHKANVNIHQRDQRAFGIGGPPTKYETPIHRAVRQCNPQLVSLFIQKAADVNTQVQFDQKDSLLSVAVQKNDPDTLTVLLNAYSKANYYNNVKVVGIFKGTMSKIDYAYVRACILDGNKDKEVADLLLNIKDETVNKAEYAQLFKDKRTKCKTLLSQAKVLALGFTLDS